MNRQRRKAIDGIIEKLKDLNSEIEQICEDEEEYFDNMPESIQYGEKGDVSKLAIENLEDACNQIDEAVSALEEAK